MKHYLGVLSIYWYIHRKRSSSSHIQTLFNAVLSRHRPPTPLRLALKPLTAAPRPPPPSISGLREPSWYGLACLIFLGFASSSILSVFVEPDEYTQFYILILISWSHGFYHGRNAPTSVARWASLLSSLHPSRSHRRWTSKSSENTSKKASQYLKSLRRSETRRITNPREYF